MRVDWAILCRYAEAEGGLAAIMGAGIDTFWSTEFPVTILAPIVIRVVGTEDEMAHEHAILFRVLAPDLSALAEVEIQLDAALNPLREPGWEQAAVFVTAHQIEVESPGTYSIEIDIDGQHMKSVPFRVRPAKEAAPGRSS